MATDTVYFVMAVDNGQIYSPASSRTKDEAFALLRELESQGFIGCLAVYCQMGSNEAQRVS